MPVYALWQNRSSAPKSGELVKGRFMSGEYICQWFDGAWTLVEPVLMPFRGGMPGHLDRVDIKIDRLPDCDLRQWKPLGVERMSLEKLGGGAENGS